MINEIRVRVMSDKTERVVRGWIHEPPEPGFVVIEVLEYQETENDEPVTLLLHEGDKIGGLKPWMVPWMKYRGLCTEEEILDHERLPVEFLDKSSEEIDQIIATAIDRILQGGTE